MSNGTFQGSIGKARPLTHALCIFMQEAETMNDAWRAGSVSDIDGSSPRTIGDGAVYEEDESTLSVSDAPVPAGVTSAAHYHHARPAALSYASLRHGITDYIIEH